MDEITPQQRSEAKALGFQYNRITGNFSARILLKCGVLSAAQMHAAAEAAERFGDKELIFTTRLSLEIQDIPHADIPAFIEFVTTRGLKLVRGGNTFRSVVVCKGTTCVFGQGNVRAFAEKIHTLFYEPAEPLPYKFKIGIGGCQNNCAKPDLNDFGAVAQRINGETVYRIFLGGRWGRKKYPGIEQPGTYTEEQVLEKLRRAVEFFKANGKPGERFGDMLRRLGRTDVD